MSKKALLVGINNFVQRHWRLRGCINDTTEMQELLATYFDFQQDDITVLNDKDATAQGIIDGLQWLLSEYDDNDVRIFYFSGYGTQVDNSGEDEWECIDEVIVPYDHDWHVPLRYDDLQGILDCIPERVCFTFIADCCHSGSIQKAILDSHLEFDARYLTPPEDLAERIAHRRSMRDREANAWAGAQMAAMLQGVPQERWPEKIREYLPLLLSRFRENRYGVVVPRQHHAWLVPCEDRQTAIEARIESDFRGVFSWALGQAIREANGNLTYGELVTRAGTKTRSFEQMPRLECPSGLRTLKVFAPIV